MKAPVIRAQHNKNAEPWPETMACECGGELKLVSIDEGYVCDNAECIMSGGQA